MSKYIVGITGASGSIYGIRLVEELLKCGHEVHLTITPNGYRVAAYETDCSLEEAFCKFPGAAGRLKIYAIDDLFAPVASGSFKTEGMIVIPCSMSTMGEIAAGSSKTLLGRAADVAIKEKHKLILVPRETPLSTIHLRNMLTLGEMGVTILPAMPGFYHKPQHLADMVDFMIGKVLDALGIENNLYEKWGK